MASLGTVPFLGASPQSGFHHFNGSNSSSSSSQAVYRIQLFPHRENVGNRPPFSSAGFKFNPIEKEVKAGVVIKIGRKVDRKIAGNAAAPATSANAPNDNAPGAVRPSGVQSDLEPTQEDAQQNMVGVLPNNNNNNTPQVEQEAGEEAPEFVTFRSKVVSRTHAEMWVNSEGQLIIKDVGKIVCHHQPKKAGPHPVKSGDVIQLGVDYQDRQEEIFKCVIIKVFVSVKPRDRPKLNPYRLRTALRALLAAMNPNARDPTDASCTDCAICLSTISPLQSLFLAPCSHYFHYRCVMPLLGSNVMFQCPLCRQVANLVPPTTEEEEEAFEDEFSAAIAADIGAESGGERDASGPSEPHRVDGDTVTMPDQSSSLLSSALRTQNTGHLVPEPARPARPVTLFVSNGPASRDEGSRSPPEHNAHLPRSHQGESQTAAAVNRVFDSYNEAFEELLAVSGVDPATRASIAAKLQQLNELRKEAVHLAEKEASRNDTDDENNAHAVDDRDEGLDTMPGQTQGSHEGFGHMDSPMSPSEMTDPVAAVAAEGRSETRLHPIIVTDNAQASNPSPLGSPRERKGKGRSFLASITSKVTKAGI